MRINWFITFTLSVINITVLWEMVQMTLNIESNVSLLRFYVHSSSSFNPARTDFSLLFFLVACSVLFCSSVLIRRAHSQMVGKKLNWKRSSSFALDSNVQFGSVFVLMKNVVHKWTILLKCFNCFFFSFFLFIHPSLPVFRSLSETTFRKISTSYAFSDTLQCYISPSIHSFHSLTHPAWYDFVEVDGKKVRDWKF